MRSIPRFRSGRSLGRLYVLGNTAGQAIQSRRALLEAVRIAVPADLGRAGLVAAADDVLDAAVAAWSAQRIATGHGRALPDPPERDTEGRPMAIWY
jgi:predicted RNase H-like nuclease